MELDAQSKRKISRSEMMLSMLESKDISKLMLDLFEEFLDEFPLQETEQSVIQHTNLSYIHGFLLAHSKSPSPTPIMLAGAIMGSVERRSDEIVNKIGDTILGERNE